MIRKVSAGARPKSNSTLTDSEEYETHTHIFTSHSRFEVGQLAQDDRVLEGVAGG